MCPHIEMQRVKENMPFEILEKLWMIVKTTFKKINLFWLGTHSAIETYYIT